MKNELWDRIIKQKIVNQAKVLQLSGCKREVVNRLLELSEEVEDGDDGKREGISARLFFH